MPDGERRSGDYLSLYRRFRPQRFDEVLGQEHVSVALRNAVRQDMVAHAYLFSGPRGTGKTSTARILAKALNCAAPEDGEPCGRCQSCIEIARGTSLDVHELDAASNNGVDAMRDLVARAALGTPGRWKVYIVDEVHNLSPQASNALLKTLEEPPGHVVFVLATTDAQKVLPTVRSRTQHFEFRLLGPETLSGLVHRVSSAAQLEVGEAALAAAVRKGRGSARDALSALDQLAAAGVVDEEVPVLAELGEALAERDAARALVAVAHAVAAGRDVHTLTGALVEYLRQGFLFMVAPDLVSAPPDDRQSVEEMARRMGLPAVVRSMESLGRAQVDMRDAPDPRVNLEAALIRLAHPDADDSAAAILERIDRLERAVSGGSPSAGGAPGSAPAASRGSPPTSADTEDGSPSPPAARPNPGSGPDLARQSLGTLRRNATQSTQATQEGQATQARRRPATSVPPEPASPPEPSDGTPPASGTSPTRDQLTEAWGDGLLSALAPRARSRFRVGRFIDAQGDTAVFALPNGTHRSYCEEVRPEVEHTLTAHFGTPIHLRLVVDEEGNSSVPGGRGSSTGAGEPVGRGVSGPGEEDGALLDPMVLATETEPAGAGLSPEQRLKQVFPGAEEV